jgi:hypothetical protein
MARAKKSKEITISGTTYKVGGTYLFPVTGDEVEILNLTEKGVTVRFLDGDRHTFPVDFLKALWLKK